ncbi:Tetratricopeptide repeat protein 5, partial [Linum grandiflorum]
AKTDRPSTTRRDVDRSRDKRRSWRCCCCCPPSRSPPLCQPQPSHLGKEQSQVVAGTLTVPEQQSEEKRLMGSANPVSPQAVEEEDRWDTVRTSVDDLHTIVDTYFPPNPDDKLSKLQAQSDACLSLLDSIPQEQRRSSSQRALYEYLRGKALDVFPNYRKEAEDHLSKAVKLNPSLADAWLCLGNTIWKKGDLTSAKNCFNLALSKGPNKKILCLLSMLERKMAQGAQNQAEIVDESIQHAKDAIGLDVKDGNSWCKILGDLGGFTIAR